MAQSKQAWSLFADTFLVAVSETVKEVAELTHDGLQYLADKTKPEEVVASPEKEPSIREKVHSAIQENAAKAAVTPEKDLMDIAEKELGSVLK